MTRLIKTRCLLALILGVCVGVTALLFWHEVSRRRNVFDRTYRVGADHSPPYTLLAPDGSMKGLAVDILNEAARRRGIHLKWVPVTTTLDESIARGVVDMWSTAVMDVQMPNMDGFEAASAIRSHEKDRSHIAIIALTAHAMKGDCERCLAAGMDAYISKPIRVQELNDAIEKLAITRAEIPAA